MVDSKSLKICIWKITKNPEILRFVPDYFKKKKDV